MAVKFPAGTAVKQVVPAPVEGVVSRFIFDETSGDIVYVVTSDTPEGPQESTFREDQIAAV